MMRLLVATVLSLCVCFQAPTSAEAVGKEDSFLSREDDRLTVQGSLRRRFPVIHALQQENEKAQETSSLTLSRRLSNRKKDKGTKKKRNKKKRKNKRTNKESKDNDETCNFNLKQIDFGGFASLYSARRGTIQAAWNHALVESRVSNESIENNFAEAGCDYDISYVFLAAKSPFDFTKQSLDELMRNPKVVKYETEEVSVTIDENLRRGTTYDMLVVARAEFKKEELLSTNRDATSIEIAQANPKLRSDVKRVLAVGESSNQEMKDIVKAERIDSGSIKFLIDDNKKTVNDFEVGDWVVGELSMGEPFLVKLQSLVEDEQNSATWNVLDGSIVDIFEQIQVNAAVSSSSLYAEATTEVDDNGDATRRRLLFDVNVKVRETEVLPIKFSASVTVGLATFSASLDFKEVTKFSLDVKGDIFGLDKMDVRVEVDTSLKNTFQLEFKNGTDLISEEEPVVLWSGRPIQRSFLIGGIPVLVGFFPSVKYTFKRSLRLEAFLLGKLEYSMSTKNTVTFDLKNGWKEVSTRSVPIWDGDVDAGGRAILDASLNLRLELGVLLYFTAWVAPFVQAGPSLTVEATTLPLPAQLQPANLFDFYLSKLELGAKVSVGVEAEFRADIPFFDEQEFKIKEIFEIPYLLLTLPSAGINLKSFNQCVGENAIEMAFSIQEGTYTEPIANSLKSPAEFVPVVMQDGSLDTSWIIRKVNDKEAVVALPRSVITSREYYQVPEGRMYYRSSADIPMVGVLLLFDQELDELALPTLDGFDCCSDEDCATKFPEEESIPVCEDMKCIVEDTPVPTTTPTLEPQPTPIPDSSDDEGGGDNEGGGSRSGPEGASSGDPHIITYDGLSYDCQGRGEFVLTTSGDMQVHTRFRKSGRVALTTGLAASEGNGTTIVEVSIPESSSSAPVVLIDSVVQEFLPYEDSDMIVRKSQNNYEILFKNSQLFTSCTYFGSFGRWLNCRVTLPPQYVAQGTLGLLGSADGDSLNDWMDSNGTGIPIPSTYGELRGSTALSYCVTNWCIRDAASSLFTHYEGPGFTFEDYSGCDDDLSDAIDLSQASPELRALCGNDEACLIDGIENGVDAARAQLNAQASLLSTASVFQVSPTAVAVETVFNLAITVNLKLATESTESIDEFHVYRIDRAGARSSEAPIVILKDEGSGLGHDGIAGDMVFSNRLAVFSEEAGETFGFTAVGILDGVENGLTFTRLDAVISYSNDSGLGQKADEALCGGSCDDGNPCTIDSCNVVSGLCESEQVACSLGDACDSFTGQCRNLQDIIPCVAVIDEWNGINYANEWATFRSQYPQRPFCLLVPNANNQTLPTGFDDDTVNNSDGVDRTLFSLVNRDNGIETLASDWFNSCQLGNISKDSINYVGLFVDTSGSMTLNTVRASYDQFLEDLNNASLGFRQVFNGVERWIDPFLTTLVPPTGG